MIIGKPMMQTIYTFPMEDLYNPSMYNTTSEHRHVSLFITVMVPSQLAQYCPFLADLKVTGVKKKKSIKLHFFQVCFVLICFFF